MISKEALMESLRQRETELQALQSKCGFVTVLEYQMNIQFSLRASEEASNEAADEQIWYAQENWGYKIGKDEEE